MYKRQDVFLVANPLHPSAQATASGQLSISDADAGEAFFVAETVEGDFGSLTVTADGAWTYTLDPDFSITGDITSVDDTITVQSVDGTTQSITVTINDAGDAPADLSISLVGTDGDDVLVGGGGDDTLIGLDGDDTVSYTHLTLPTILLV